MRIGSVSYRCKNKDTAFYMRQIERAMQESRGKAELLRFGEEGILFTEIEGDRRIGYE